MHHQGLASEVVSLEQQLYQLKSDKLKLINDQSDNSQRIAYLESQLDVAKAQLGVKQRSLKQQTGKSEELRASAGASQERTFEPHNWPGMFQIHNPVLLFTLPGHFLSRRRLKVDSLDFSIVSDVCQFFLCSKLGWPAVVVLAYH